MKYLPLVCLYAGALLAAYCLQSIALFWAVVIGFATFFVYQVEDPAR